MIGIWEHYSLLDGYVKRIEGARLLANRYGYSKIATTALLELYARGSIHEFQNKNIMYLDAQSILDTFQEEIYS